MPRRCSNNVEARRWASRGNTSCTNSSCRTANSCGNVDCINAWRDIGFRDGADGACGYNAYKNANYANSCKNTNTCTNTWRDFFGFSDGTNSRPFHWLLGASLFCSWSGWTNAGFSDRTYSYDEYTEFSSIQFGGFDGFGFSDGTYGYNSRRFDLVNKFVNKFGGFGGLGVFDCGTCSYAVQRSACKNTAYAYTSAWPCVLAMAFDPVSRATGF